MNYTPNYHLPTWAMADRIQMADFNDMTSAIDTALKAEEDTRAAAVQTLTGQIAKCGNCSIGFSTYQGSGTYGPTSPTRITFPRLPTMFIAIGFEGIMIGQGGQKTGYGVINGGTKTGTTYFNFTWSGTTLSVTDNSSANGQLNGSGTHQVFAFYAES